MSIVINASADAVLNNLIYIVSPIGVLFNLLDIALIIRLNGNRNVLQIHYYTIAVVASQILNNILVMVLVTIPSSTIMWVINLNIWIFTLLALLIGSELIHCYQPLFPSLTDSRMYMLKYSIVVIYLLTNGCRIFKNLLYTSIQQDNFFAIWNRYGNPILSVSETIFLIGYIVTMFVGIHRISLKKSNKKQQEFINAKYSSAIMYLVVYSLLTVYVGALTFIIARLDSDDQFIHIFVLKLDIVLLQPIALMIFIYVKLYYLLLEIFAKKEIWSANTSKSHSLDKADHRSDTQKVPLNISKV
ncbi:hypothetical protein HDV01_003746 [Terramyces sp. JEL0728]|nr:hypothetical protein HDV01_003746 [Terramyces sp. JEL0728]